MSNMGINNTDWTLNGTLPLPCISAGSSDTQNCEIQGLGNVVMATW